MTVHTRLSREATLANREASLVQSLRHGVTRESEPAARAQSRFHAHAVALRPVSEGGPSGSDASRLERPSSATGRITVFGIVSFDIVSYHTPC